MAALWAAEYPIYGRFGYAPATLRGSLTGSTPRMRLRPDVDLGSGSVDEVPVDTYRAAASAVYDAVRRAVPGNLARDDRWWDRILRDVPEEIGHLPSRTPGEGPAPVILRNEVVCVNPNRALSGMPAESS